MKIKRKSTPLGQILQTEDEGEQLARVQALMQPAVVMTILVDRGRVGVSVVGQTIGFDAAHRILELAAQELRRQEREARQAAQSQEA